MLAYNHGKLFDLITVYQFHFDILPKDTVNEEAISKIDKGDILNEFMPLISPYNGEESFVESFLCRDMDKLIEADDMTTVLESCLDYRNFIKSLIHFYFDVPNVEYIEGDFSSLHYVGDLITKSDLDYKIKNYLLAFFLNPAVMVQKLVNNMTYIASQIAKLYEKEFKILSDLIALTTHSELFGIMEKFSDSPIDKDQKTYYSFGILRSKCIKIWCKHKYQLLYLSKDYKTAFEERKEFNLDVFGTVISDPGRVRLLYYILEKGQVTVNDISSKFNLSGTTAYYHVSMMQKAGMIFSKNMRKSNDPQGKTLYYSLNSSYFNRVIMVLKKFGEII